MGGSGLSDDDRKLWSLVARQLEPLKSTEQRIKEEARKAAVAAAASPKPLDRSGKKSVKKPTPRPRAVHRLPPVAVPAPRDIVVRESGRGRVAGVDRRTSEKLRRGQYPIEGRLDLHGMNQQQAHSVLISFVRQSHATGKRCLLVITGKGGRQRESRDGPYVNPEPPGILKRKVPEWLKQADLSPLVLSTVGATPAHGGAGALYILLKRRRES